MFLVPFSVEILKKFFQDSNFYSVKIQILRIFQHFLLSIERGRYGQGCNEGGV